MKKIFLLFVCVLAWGTTIQAQNFRTFIPEGYSIKKAWQDKELIIEADFNDDNLMDYFMVIEKEEFTKFFVLINSKDGLQVQSNMPFRLEDFYCCSMIELLPKNVIKLSSLGNRYFEYYKFRWDNQKGEFRIIGYDNEGLPDNYGDSYQTSFNFYTRQLITTTNHNNFETGTSTSKIEKKYMKGVGKFYLKDFSSCTGAVSGDYY